jgi:hypothetical protein
MRAGNGNYPMREFRRAAFLRQDGSRRLPLGRRGWVALRSWYGGRDRPRRHSGRPRRTRCGNRRDPPKGPRVPRLPRTRDARRHRPDGAGLLPGVSGCRRAGRSSVDRAGADVTRTAEPAHHRGLARADAATPCRVRRRPSHARRRPHPLGPISGRRDSMAFGTTPWDRSWRSLATPPRSY